MVAGDQVGRHLLAGQHGSDRNAAAEPLGQGHHIGRDAVILERERGAAATDAGLDLIQDEERPTVAGQLLQAPQVVARGREHARLPLHRLDQDGAGTRSGLPGRRLQVSEGNATEAGRERLERSPVALDPGRRQRPQGATVKTPLHGEDLDRIGSLLRPSPLPRQLDRRLVRLGAAVAEEGLRQPARLREQTPRLGLLRDLVEVGDVQQATCLLGDRADQLGVRVAETGDGDPGGEVQVLPSLEIPEPRAPPVRERDRRPRVGAEQMALRCLADTRGAGARARPGDRLVPPVGAARRRPRASWSRGS